MPPPPRPWLHLALLVPLLLLHQQVAAAAAACTPSSLGYACKLQTAAGVLVHWSLGGAPPANNCTAAATGHSHSSGAASVAHFALEAAAAPGWLALAFPSMAGEMWPADAVIGGLTDGNGTPAPVSSYQLRRYRVTGEDATSGWAQNAGLASSGSGGGGTTKLLCFSRALDSPNAAVVKSINASARARALLLPLQLPCMAAAAGCCRCAYTAILLSALPPRCMQRWPSTGRLAAAARSPSTRVPARSRWAWLTAPPPALPRTTLTATPTRRSARRTAR